jgi:hypothetical protein
MSAFTTADLGKRFSDAANRAADYIEQGIDPYQAVAYGGPGKAAAPNYAAQVGLVIATDQRITSIFNQGRRETTAAIYQAREWLDRDDTGWVHCYSANMPNPSRFRVYVCTALPHTHSVLRELLQNYGGSLKFKVATHAEAQRRNDTIVSWHGTLREAQRWGTIAQASVALLEGEAPAGTFGPFSRAIGIDTEVTGDTSTHRIARAAEAAVERRSIKGQMLV